MSEKVLKTETIEEFLARGGKIKVYPPEQSGELVKTAKSTSHDAPVIYSLDEGAHFFAEKSKRIRKKKELNFTTINMDLIPESIKKNLKIK